MKISSARTLNANHSMFFFYRAAAEWIVRNGGSVKFAGFDKCIEDYNALPTGPKTKKYFLQEIIARNTSLTDNGFEHLGINHLILSHQG